MFEKVGAIIPAGGCGKFPGSRVPKILEPLTHWTQSLIAGSVRPVIGAGINTVGIVLNNNRFRQFREDVLNALHEDGIDCSRGHNIHIAHQSWRLGAAQAVELGLHVLPESLHTILVTYADMLLWRPATIRQLVETHLATRAVVSIVALTLRSDTPGAIRNYGRILRDGNGKILDIIEPQQPAMVEPDKVISVNPSLYAFDRWWLLEKLGRIRAVDKGDGFEPEFHLSCLLKIAHDEKAPVAEVPLDDHEEALGVNTLEELEEVAIILAGREQREIQARER